MKNRIKEFIALRESTQSQLADLVGVGKGFISEVIAGKKNPSWETQLAIASALDVAPGALFMDERPVAVAGRVGAGAEVELVDAYPKGEGLYHVTAPEDLPAAGIVAVEVLGDSMEPLIEEGDIIFFTRHFVGIDEAAIGHVGILCTADGRALVKKIMPGRDPGTFDLYSVNPTTPPEYGSRLVWAAPMRRHIRKQDVERADPP